MPDRTIPAPATAAQILDRLEALKLRILYFERLATHFFSFMFLASLVWCGFVFWIFVEELRQMLGREPLTFTGLLGLPSLSLLALMLVIAGMLFVVLVYARSINRVGRGSIRTTRVVALIVVVIGGAYFAHIVSQSGLWPMLADYMLNFFGAPLQHWTGIAILALLFGATAVPQYHYHVSYRALMRIEPADALILRENPDRKFTSRLLRDALGVPRIVDYMPRGRLLASLFFTVANAFYALSTSFFMVGAVIWIAQYFDVHVSCSAGADLPCVADRGEFYLILLIVACASAFAVAPVIGRLIVAWARRSVRFSIEALLHRDERPPILFLRPFKDDQVRLEPAEVMVLARIGGWLDSIASLDELMLEEGTPYGPVVAIGNPGDKLPPYGAARGYFDDKTWQMAVADLAERAIAIVICIDDFEGVWWEVENVVSRHIDKTLILLPPASAGLERNAEIMTKLISRLATRAPQSLVVAALGNVQVEQAQAPPVLGIFTDAGRTRIAVSSSFSQLAYLVEVRMFLRSKLGLAGGPA